MIALAANGQARTVIARDGGFSLVPPAATATLHLRAPDGTYVGPIVLSDGGSLVRLAKAQVRRAKRSVRQAQRRVRLARGSAAKRRAARRLRLARSRLRKANRSLRLARRELARRATSAVVGVKAGAPLGGVTVNAAAGYGSARRITARVWRTLIDTTRRAQATHGVPIGAGNFGRVRSGLAGARGDLDRDGVPDPLDIDDDGDLILDNLDASTAVGRARSAQTGGCGPSNIYCPAVSTGLQLFLQDTVNANAGSSTDAINAALRAHSNLQFFVRGGVSAELDCGDPNSGLVYCRQNGSTGTAAADFPPGPPFPGPPGGAFDSDGDGFGLLNPALEPAACGGACPQFFLLHGASTDQIGSGDVLVEHLATGGDPSRCPPPPGTSDGACDSLSTTLQYVFATVPAIVGYSDTAGHAATVSYPVLAPGVDCSRPGCPGGLGTQNNGFPVSPGPDGNIVVRLTLWRPQRKAIPGSDPPTATWMDVGHLTYGVFPQASPGTLKRSCPQSAFAEDDPNLTPATSHIFLQGGGGFEDAKNDEQSSPGDTTPGRTLSFTLNLTQCLAAQGTAFAAGDNLEIQFIAAPGAPAFVQQTSWFKRE